MVIVNPLIISDRALDTPRALALLLVQLGLVSWYALNYSRSQSGCLLNFFLQPQIENYLHVLEVFVHLYAFILIACPQQFTNMFKMSI